MIKFELDLEPLKKAIDKSSVQVEKGVVESLDAIKDDWVSEARDIAPIESGNLRKQIKGKVLESGLNSEIMVSANAVNRTKGYGRFNYAYYIHEGYMEEDGKKLRTPGTEKRFLDKSVDTKKWQNFLINKVLSRLRGTGWESD